MQNKSSKMLSTPSVALTEEPSSIIGSTFLEARDGHGHPARQSGRSSATASTYCSIDSFAAKAELALKHDDMEEKLLVSSTDLVGRDQEMTALNEAINSVLIPANPGKKRTRVVSISGAAGTGKSRLVNEALAYVGNLSSDGYICKGKYTPEGGETGLAGSIKDLVLQVVDQDWDMGTRRRLQEIISPEDAAVLIETFPALSILLAEDEGPVQQELDHVRRAKRRQFLFLQLIASLTKPDACQYEDEDIEEPQELPQGCVSSGSEAAAYPLVFVLDDCHWADKPSMELISALVRDSEQENFLLITTNRPLEPNVPSCPFLQELDRWKALGIPMESIHLENLDKVSVNVHVSNLLDTNPSMTSPLSDIIYQKTKGNPFFTTQFLKRLVDQNLVKFNFGELKWDFDLPRIQCTETNDSAVGLLKERLQELSAEHQNLLLVASCLGASFRRSFLERVLAGDSIVGEEIEFDAKHVESILKECVDFGVLDCSSDKEIYFFCHDIIKEASLTFGDDKHRRLLKLRLGNFILQTRGTRAADPNNALLYVAVDLCNDSSSLLDKENPLEWVNLARYNLLAGQKAIRESIFGAALNYMETGLKHLETNAKAEKGSKLSLDLLAGAAEAVYCMGNFEKMGAWADRVLNTPGCPKETQLQMMYIQILSTFAQDEQCHQALQVGRQAISLLGVGRFPADPSLPAVLVEFYKTKRILRRHTADSLIALPMMKDENRITAMRFLDAIQVPAFLAAPNFFLVSCLRALRWSIKYGICQYSPVLFAFYAFIRFTAFGDSGDNVMYSEVALKLAERLDIKEITARTSMICFCHCRHWTTEMRLCYQPIAYSHKLAMEVGDTEIALQSFVHMDNIAWCTTMHSIQTLARHLCNHVAMANEYKQNKTAGVLTCLARGLQRLCSVDDKSFSWLGKAPLDSKEQKMNDDPGIQGFYDVVHLQSHYLFGEKEEALKVAKRTGGVGKTILQGVEFVSRTHLYRGLIFFSEASEGRNVRGNKRAAMQAVKMLQNWIAGGDINSIHMLRLLDAEHARITGKVDKAKESYLEAIQRARDTGHRHDLGISNECAAVFYLQQNDPGRAAHHIEQAEKAFRDWGAGAKAKQLTKKYSSLLRTHGSTVLSFRT